MTSVAMTRYLDRVIPSGRVSIVRQATDDQPPPHCKDAPLGMWFATDRSGVWDWVDIITDDILYHCWVHQTVQTFPSNFGPSERNPPEPERRQRPLIETLTALAVECDLAAHRVGARTS